VGATTDRPVQEAAHHAVESGVLDLPVHPVPRADRQKQLYRNIGIAAVMVVAAILLITLMARDSELEKGIVAVQAQRWDAAQNHLEKAARDKDNATAQVYLARVYRRQQRYDRAATVLKEASVKHSEDDDIWRELGYLFLDLGQPQLAVARFQKARQLDPKEKLNWIGLVRAMREAGDPAAEQVLQEAPPEVQSAMTRTN
jgi:tetratricopeptide (TPR) repeat protein